MNNLKANNIWGIPMEIPFLEPYINVSRPRNIVSIKRQLHTFLTEQIETWKPRLIIVIERKGTAILRALKEWDESPLDLPWEKVISSSVVDQMPPEYFSGKKILVFDDMMRTGEHLKKLLQELQDRDLWSPGSDNLRVAIFAVHQDSSGGIQIKGENLPYTWFYRDLTTTAYQRIWMQIVNMLQQAGSLMLDTEHIEVRVRLRGNFNQFFKAIRRKAQAVVFRSSDQRNNVTVMYPDDKAHELPVQLFPEGTDFSRIVKKCRVIRLTMDEFSIIPICYPCTLESSKEWPKNKDDLDLLGDSVLANQRSCFYGVALIASLEVLKWVLKDIAVMGANNYSVSLPTSPNDKKSMSGYCLDHLTVMYPTLKVGRLTQRISEIENEARSQGIRLRKRKFTPFESPLTNDEELDQNAISLLQVIRYVLDQKREEYWENNNKYPDHPFGLRTREIFDLGKRLGWEDSIISALFDILIDEAYLVTHAQEITDDNGDRRCARTFEPDGEMVSKLIRRLTNQWGLPHGF